VNPSQSVPEVFVVLALMLEDVLLGRKIRATLESAQVEVKLRSVELVQLVYRPKALNFLFVRISLTYGC
jgi:hypothetical protein